MEDPLSVLLVRRARTICPGAWLTYLLPVPSTFNAFSRVDVRVEVKIPGGVDAYIVDLRGERHAPTQAIWTEVYLSALLRAILYADDPNYKVAGFRKLDPIKTLDDEVRFLNAAEACSGKGMNLCGQSGRRG